MFKKIFIAFCMMLCALGLMAQEHTGGVKGNIVSRFDRSPVSNAGIALYSGTTQIASTVSATDGSFLIENISNGMYELVIDASDYIKIKSHIAIIDGSIKNMFTIYMSPSRMSSDVEDMGPAEFDMDECGYNDSPTIIFGQNDVFNNTASYNFSSVRFRVRGYANESQDVMLAGVRMNDAVTGYVPYSLWSGLNEATRAKSTVAGTEVSDYALGGYNGVTNIYGDADNIRKGLRGSVLTNSALYRLRLMMTYASGPLDNGWSYAFSASARLGGNDWVKGVFYRSFGYYASVSKKFNDAHKLGLTLMAAPGERGAQNGSTQEVYDLMGDNMYNSNWGYQNGKIRNSRVRRTHEPIVFLKYDFTPSSKLNASATLLYRFGKNGYTALDWYDALDPRPDYYRNLPSYFYMENPDYDRTNFPKYAWAKEAWEMDYAPTTHVDWDRLYRVNMMNSTPDGNRSKYIVEERRTDQQDLNFAAKAKWRAKDFLSITGGLNARYNRTEFYKIVDDLLGGDYYLNVNQFAERDFASDETKYQNNLDYYIANGKAQSLKKGDKFGYDYYAHIYNVGGWANAGFSFGDFIADAGLKLGYEGFWKEGLVRNGLFPDDSKGVSKKSSFITYGTKLGLKYAINGKMRVYANIGYFNEAPKFRQAFISPRTRNSLMENIVTTKVFSSDINYQLSMNGCNFRITGYYTTINDQSKVMSFYDDLQHAFTNFAMKGIDERHIGIELGFKVLTPVPYLSVKGVLSYGSYVYTSNPTMTQTIDNSSEVVIKDEVVPYWKSHPSADGKTIRHYVSGTPQLASSLGLLWNKNYWFVDADVNYFGKTYLDMNPLYRTDYATAGPDGKVTVEEIEYMAAQELFKPVFLANLSVGKSWYIKRKYQLGFSLQVRNMLNNKSVRTGGYEQNRLVDKTVSKERYYRFDSKYFYMSGFNYMLNIYFRF